MRYLTIVTVALVLSASFMMPATVALAATPTARPLTSAVPAAAAPLPHPIQSTAGGQTAQTSGSLAAAADATKARANADSPALPQFVWVLISLFELAAVLAVMYYVYGRASATTRAQAVLGCLVALLGIGLAAPAWVGLADSRQWIFVDLIALGVALSAAFFGFLFGLPQAVQKPADGSNAVLRPSTNLETVAEQLTKYVTGAAFASIAAAAGLINDFGHAVFDGFKPPNVLPYGWLFGDVLFIYFAPLGFLLGYIMTRTVGSYAFARADEALYKGGTTLIATFVLPDVGQDATPEQRALAAQIAAIPFTDLETDDERLTWARAQTVLGHVDSASMAYRILYASRPNDPEIIIEFATTLYNDPNFTDYQFVLQTLERALPLLPADDEKCHARVAGLKAATYLYIPDHYVETITVVNDFLNQTSWTPLKTMHFYRACAFGQLYHAYRDRGGLPPNDPDVSRLIMLDTAVTIGFGPDYRKQLQIVSSPAFRGPNDTSEDDLQAFAADNAPFRARLGITPPPQPAQWTRNPVPLPQGMTPGQYAASCP